MPSAPRGKCGDLTSYEENHLYRPPVVVLHRPLGASGQGKKFDTEFNINGAKPEVVKGYYTTVVTDMAAP